MRNRRVSACYMAQLLADWPAEVAASIILTRQSDEGFNCSPNTSYDSFSEHTPYTSSMLIWPEPPHFTVSLLSQIPLYLSCCLLHGILQWEKNILGIAKITLLSHCWSFIAKCQNLDTCKVNSVPLSLGYPSATEPLPVQPQKESCNLRQ